MMRHFIPLALFLAATGLAGAQRAPLSTTDLRLRLPGSSGADPSAFRYVEGTLRSYNAAGVETGSWDAETGLITAPVEIGEISAGEISAGTLGTDVTVQDGSLSGNIPRLNAASNSFTGNVNAGTFSGSYGAFELGLTGIGGQSVAYSADVAATYAPIHNPTFTGTASGTFSGTHSGNGAGLTGVSVTSANVTGDFAISRITGLQTSLDGKMDDGQAIPISQITNLQTSLNAKAPLASPAFTGTATGTFSGTHIGNGSQLTNLEAADITGDFAISRITGLQTALNAKAPLANPTFTGSVTLPTASTISAVSNFSTLSFAPGGALIYDTTEVDGQFIVNDDLYVDGYITASGFDGPLDASSLNSGTLPDARLSAAGQDAIAKRHSQNTDTGTVNFSFNVGSDDDSATLLFGQPTGAEFTQGSIAYDGYGNFNYTAGWNLANVKADVFYGSGAGLTNLQSASLVGTINDSLLSGNIARTNNPTFTGTVTAGSFVGDGSGLTNLPSSGGDFTSSVNTPTAIAGIPVNVLGTGDNRSFNIGNSTAITGANTNRIGIGPGAILNAGVYSYGLGWFAANSAGNYAVGVGQSAARSGGIHAVGIGSNAGYSASGNYAISIGYDSNYQNNGIGAIGIGYQANENADAPYSIAIGYDARAHHSESIALGRNTLSTAANQFTVGSRELVSGNITANAGGITNHVFSQGATERLRVNSTGAKVTGAIETGGMVVPYKLVQDSNYQVLTTDYYIQVNAASGPFTITMPQNAPVGQIYRFHIDPANATNVVTWDAGSGGIMSLAYAFYAQTATLDVTARRRNYDMIQIAPKIWQISTFQD